MPNKIENDLFKKYMKSIFEYKSNIMADILIIDTLKEDILTSEGVKFLNELYYSIKNFNKSMKVYIKSHPRDTTSKLSGLEYFEDNSLPLEMLYYDSDINNITFITVSSTAVFTPKLLYNKEPKIILLYKLLTPYLIQSIDMDAFVEKFQLLYKDNKKIYIPDSIEQLLIYLND